MSGLIFHHFGLAVRESREAVMFLSALGYRISPPVFDANQNVHLMMGLHDTQPAVEIIYPGINNGPIDKLIRQHATGIIYHVCYVSKNLELSLEQLETAGLRVVCVSPPKPAVLFEGQNVSFYNVMGMGLVEILEARQYS